MAAAHVALTRERRVAADFPRKMRAAMMR